MFKLTVVGCVINYNREQILLSGHFNLNVNPSHSIEHLLASQRISLNMSWMLRCSQWHLSVKKIAHHTISQHALDQFNYRSLYHLFIPVFFFFFVIAVAISINSRLWRQWIPVQKWPIMHTAKQSGRWETGLFRWFGRMRKCHSIPVQMWHSSMYWESIFHGWTNSLWGWLRWRP